MTKIVFTNIQGSLKRNEYEATIITKYDTIINKMLKEEDCKF